MTGTRIRNAVQKARASAGRSAGTAAAMWP